MGLSGLSGRGNRKLWIMMVKFVGRKLLRVIETLNFCSRIDGMTWDECENHIWILICFERERWLTSGDKIVV